MSGHNKFGHVFRNDEIYNFIWPDGAIAEFQVLSTDYRTVMRINIVFLTNGAKNSFVIGSEMYKNSFLKGTQNV